MYHAIDRMHALFIQTVLKIVFCLKLIEIFIMIALYRMCSLVL